MWHAWDRDERINKFECQEPLSGYKCTNRDRDHRQRDIHLGTGTKDLGIGMVAPVHSMKEKRGVVVQFYSFSTSKFIEHNRPNSRHDHFTPVKMSGTH